MNMRFDGGDGNNKFSNQIVFKSNSRIKNQIMNMRFDGEDGNNKFSAVSIL